MTLIHLPLDCSGSGTAIMMRSSVCLPPSAPSASTPISCLRVGKISGKYPTCCSRRRLPISLPSPQTEHLITTLKPTAVDQIDYKPGIHEDIYLRLKVKNSKMTFAWSQDGKRFSPCGEEFQMKEGKWIGAKFGFIAVETDSKCDRGWIDADWIRITK